MPTTFTRCSRLAAAALLLTTANLAHAQAYEGEVRKIDRAQAKITLRHGELKALEMPPMTMIFRLADPKLLDGLAEGAKVRFDAENRNGLFTVTRITVQ